MDQLSSKLNTPMASGSGGGGSTTPTYEPNGPPPISPALPPLELGTGDVNGLDLGDKGKKTGEGKWILLFSRLSLCSPRGLSRTLSRIRQEIKIKLKLEKHDNKVILNLTNLRYIILNTITPCSSFRQKDKACIYALRKKNYIGQSRRYTVGRAASLFILDFGGIMTKARIVQSYPIQQAICAYIPPELCPERDIEWVCRRHLFPYISAVQILSCFQTC